jgi:hypothetical protein
MAWLELHKHINIAFRSEVISQHRPEERSTADVMSAAKIGNFIQVNRYARHVCLLPGRYMRTKIIAFPEASSQRVRFVLLLILSLDIISSKFWIRNEGISNIP